MLQRRRAFAVRPTEFGLESDRDGGQEDYNRRTYYTLGLDIIFTKRFFF